MKKIILISIFLLGMSYSYSQDDNRYWKDFIRNMGYIVTIDYKYNIPQGDSFTINKKFYKDHSYMIMVNSDDKYVLDIDLYIYKNNILYLKDTDDSKLCLIRFIPVEDTYLEIRIKNKKSTYTNNPVAIWCIISYK